MTWVKKSQKEPSSTPKLWTSSDRFGSRHGPSRPGRGPEGPAITHHAVAEVAAAVAAVALRVGPAIQLQSRAPPRLCFARPRH